MKHHANIAIFVPHAGCSHRCAFCDQGSISGARSAPRPAEVSRILREAAESMGERARKAEIAFFGGSFTAIDAELRRSLLDAAQPYLQDFAGIRVSTRPDAIASQILDELKAYGVTAVELGAQSMDNAVLELARRGHTAADVIRASGLIKDAGFSLGLQMMTGLPGDTGEGSEETARRLAALLPDTVRIYPALTLTGSGLEKMYRDGSYTPPALDETVALCARLLLFFKEQRIPVIRLGLQETPELLENIVAGPHYPALRELAEGKALLDSATLQIRERQIPPGRIRLTVAPGSEGRMAGQNRRNTLALAGMGYHAGIFADDNAEYLDVKVSALQ